MGFQDDFARNLNEQRRGGDGDVVLEQKDEGICGSVEGEELEPSSPTPRHDGWTPGVRVKFLEALANCGNVSSAAAFVQMSRTAAYNLKQRDIDFSRGWDAAILLARGDATDVLQDRAINGIEEDIYYQGEVIGTRQRYDSRLLLAHIARLDKLAERVSVSRGAARFGEMIDAIAAEEDTTALITEPTTTEIAEIIAEVEAEATVRQVEAACLRQNNAAATAELSAEHEPATDTWAEAEARYGRMHEIDWNNDQPLEYCRMTADEATELCADHPQIKLRPVTQYDPAFVATIMATSALARAGLDGS